MFVTLFYLNKCMSRDSVIMIATSKCLTIYSYRMFVLGIKLNFHL